MQTSRLAVVVLLLVAVVFPQDSIHVRRLGDVCDVLAVDPSIISAHNCDVLVRKIAMKGRRPCVISRVSVGSSVSDLWFYLAAVWSKDITPDRIWLAYANARANATIPPLCQELRVANKAGTREVSPTGARVEKGMSAVSEAIGSLLLLQKSEHLIHFWVDGSSDAPDRARWLVLYISNFTRSDPTVVRRIGEAARRVFGLSNRDSITIVAGEHPFFFFDDSFPVLNPFLIKSGITASQARNNPALACTLKSDDFRCNKLGKWRGSE